jgi:hypothetical protein
LQYAQNGSSPSSFESPANVTINQSWALGTKYLNTDAYIWLFGNGTSTPLISDITFFDQEVATGTDIMKDNYIQQSNPAWNNGTETYISVKARATQNMRSLIEADISSIPTGANINNATLSLYYYAMTADPVGRNYSVYVVWDNRTWTENESTWNNYTTGLPWTASGGDYNPSPIASLTVPANFGWMNWTVTQHVQAAKDAGRSNISFLIRDVEESGITNRQAYFYSKGSSNASKPALTINYSLSTSGTASFTKTTWLWWE